LVGVTVIVIASRAVDCEFESRSWQTKQYKISICCFSDKHATWLGIRIMCPSGVYPWTVVSVC